MKSLNCTDWTKLRDYDVDAKIPDDVQVVYCDTRSFALIGDQSQPKRREGPLTRYEYECNRGLEKLHSLLRVKNREKYTINANDIFKWLTELAQNSGGLNKNWRFLAVNTRYCSSAELRHCDGWDLEYIRFVRDPQNKDEFIVCNMHYYPIHYKEIVGNIIFTTRRPFHRGETRIIRGGQK